MLHPSIRRALQVALLVLLAALPCFAQTFDTFGGKITNTDGSTASTCSAFNPNYNYTSVSITGNGTTATATIGSGSFYTGIASTVFPSSPIYVIGGTNGGFDVTTGTGVLGTVTSATTLTFPNATNGSGTGYTIAAGGPWFQKVGNKWWNCSPLGHEFLPEGPTNAPATIHGTTNIVGVAQRLQGMGFNMVNVGSNGNLHATNPSETIKMPFLPAINAAQYSASNPQTCGGLPLTFPVKDLNNALPSAYTGFVYTGVPDYYDTNMLTWLEDDLSCDSPWASGTDKIGNSPNLGYVIGIASDDGDNMSGISGGGPDFTTNPAGHNTYNLAFLVATVSPLEAAVTEVMSTTGSSCNGGTGCTQAYVHTQVYTKLAERNALATEYGTIGALNTAWGSSYTTFDSSGTCVGSQPITCATSVAADSVGTGDGTTLTFSGTASHTSISAHSFQILVAGTPVAGDNEAEGSAAYTLVGPNVSSGSVNPSTGAYTITFTAGHAPANAAAITATYCSGCWGFGSGFLDEDDRLSHQTWMGTDFIALSNANAQLKADMNTFLQSIAGTYFSTMRTGIKSVFPWMNYLGPNTLGTWSAPPPAPVLRAASTYLDAFIAGGGGVLYTTAQLTYVYSNFGDKPLIQGWYTSANSDSAVDACGTGGCGVSFDYTTQPLRAQAYYTLIDTMLTTSAYPNGSLPGVGIFWWQYTDQPSQTYADGLCDVTDNCYNASDAVSGTVTCMWVTSGANTCGSEPVPSGTQGAVRPFGDLFGGATGSIAANKLWYATNYGSSSTPVVPAPTSLIAQVSKPTQQRGRH